MKKILLLFFSFLIVTLTIGQKVKADVGNKKAGKIKEEFSTPPSYYQIVERETGEMDTVMMFYDSVEIIKGPQKYKKEIIGISKYYSKILDSLKSDRFEKMSNDSLWTQNEVKNRPEKYKGYDGGYEGYLENQEDVKILNVINRFLKIDRISSQSVQSSNGGPAVYTFYYYRTITKRDGTKKSINGKVVWVDDGL